VNGGGGRHMLERQRVERARAGEARPASRNLNVVVVPRLGTRARASRKQPQRALRLVRGARTSATSPSP
jgi:hypothetical protein